MPEDKFIPLKDLVEGAITSVYMRRQRDGRRFAGIVFQGGSKEVVVAAATKISERLARGDPKLISRYEDLSHNGNGKSRSYFLDHIKRYPGRCFLVYDPERKLHLVSEYAYLIDLDACRTRLD